jgi:hypothetical protein
MSENLVALYTTILKIISEISEGERKSQACFLSGLSVSVFDRTVKSDPMLQQMLYDAEVAGIEELADVLVNIDTHHKHGRTDPKTASVVSSNIKWYLSKKRPDQYGEKVLVENRITADKVILDALSAGLERAQNRLIDITPAPSYEGPELSPDLIKILTK